MTATLTQPATATTTGKTVVLFDGVCNFCNASVNFLIDRDPADRFRFAAQQSDAGQRLMKSHGLIGLMLNTMVVLDAGKVYTHSAAAVRLTRYMGWPWKLLTAAWLVPAFLRDGVYKLIAKNRYKLFGQAEACRMPTPAIRAKFL